MTFLDDAFADAPRSSPAVRRAVHVGRFGADPSASLIEQGDSLFNKAYGASGDSLAKTAALATGLIADLPDGEFKSLVSDVMNAAGDASEGASIGAAIGSVIPGVGTVIGQAIGGIIGFIGGLFGASGPPAPPEGDMRPLAEQYIFQAVPNTPPANSADLPGLLAVPYGQPYLFVESRANSPGYQTPYIGTDPITGTQIPTRATFAVGWVSPQKSLPASIPITTASGATASAAAWWLAQTFLAEGKVAAAARKNHLAQSVQWDTLARLYRQHAITAMGGEGNLKKALAWLGKVYGTNFSSAYTPQDLGGLVDSTGLVQSAFWQRGGYEQWERIADEVNRRLPLDYTTYWSRSLMNLPGANGGESVFPVTRDHFGNTFGLQFIACPDTILVGLAELAALIALGIIPEKGSELVALHYIMSLAWLWRRGQETDPATQPPVLYNHPNLSRLIGRLSVIVKHEHAGKMRYKATARAPSPAPSPRTPSSATPKTPGRPPEQNAVTLHANSLTAGGPVATVGVGSWLFGLVALTLAGLGYASYVRKNP